VKDLSEVDSCGVFGRRVTVNSMIWVVCNKWVHKSVVGRKRHCKKLEVIFNVRSKLVMLKDRKRIFNLLLMLELSEDIVTIV
jgi:hypothetical protein